MALKPSELTRDQWVYKGWQIYFDMPPIPSRAFDWVAQSPDFDAEYDDGQLVCCGGQQVHAATYEDLLQEIEDAIACGDDA